MKNKWWWLIISSLILLTLVLLSCGQTDETEGEETVQQEVMEEEDTPPDANTLAHAGRLYDKWWVEINQEPPSGDNLVWSRQSTNTRSGTDTWRCKECHGWDYKGVDGAYGSGSHATGFPSLYKTMNKSHEEITNTLKGLVDAQHDFSALTDVHIQHLVDFIKWGMIDESKYIDSSTKKTIGTNITRGEELFNNYCMVCHGDNGKTIDIDGAGLGAIANGNPWETLHKIRFGHPGSNPPMPAGVVLGLTTEEAVDILGYAQTLPE